MKKICTECGHEIPDDSEFCHYCGRDAKDSIKFDNNGHMEQQANVCRNCWAELEQGSIQCKRCGFPVIEDVPVVRRRKITKKSWIGIALALIPGFINIFGLGHLFFKKWARGAMYIIISIPFFYLTWIAPQAGMNTTLMTLFAVFLYFVQSMEVLALAMFAGKPEE